MIQKFVPGGFDAAQGGQSRHCRQAQMMNRPVFTDRAQGARIAERPKVFTIPAGQLEFVSARTEKALQDGFKPVGMPQSLEIIVGKGAPGHGADFRQLLCFVGH